MLRLTTCSALLTTLLAAGCTCAIDPDQYLGDVDGAVPDAGPDAMIDAGPDAMVDAGDAGPLTNEPPLPSGVGLSDFQPAVDDTLRITIGPVVDPNGDSLSQDIEWTLDGATIAGATGVTLSLDAATYPAGSEIGVEVTFSDGEFSETVSAGPAIVQDDVTRWNLLLPPRGEQGSSATGVLDPERQRLIWRAAGRTIDYGIWEYQLSDSVESSWVHLNNLGGAAPDAFGNAIVPDAARDRILFLFGTRGSASGPGTVVNSVWSLDTSGPQGSGTWSQLPPSGDRPSPRSTIAHTRIDFSDGAEAIFVYGGIEKADGGGLDVTFNDAYFLHLEEGDRWEQIGDDVLTTGVVIPATFYDSDSGTVYIAGGARMGGASIVGTTAVYELSVDAPEDGFVDAGFALPDTLFGGAGVVEAGIAYIFAGARAIAADGSPIPNLDIYRVDLETGDVTTTGAPEGPADPFASAVSRAPFASDYMVYSRGFEGRAMRFFSLDVAGNWTPVTGADVNMAPPMMQGIATDASDSGAAFYGGLVDLDNAIGNADVWQWNAEGRFERIDLTPDTVTMRVPGPRWGFVADTTRPNAENFFVYGGRTNGSLPADDTLWQGSVRSGRWAIHNFSTAPAPIRTGHVLFRGYCRGTRGNLVGFQGGRDPASSAISSETWLAECSPSGDFWQDCRWFNPVSAGGAPRERVWGASTQFSQTGIPDSRHTFIFGGLSDSGVVGDAWYFDACTDPVGLSPWVMTDTLGDTPPPSLGHSLTGTISPGDTQEVSYLLFGAATEAGNGARNEVRSVTWNNDTSSPELTFSMITPAGDPPDPRAFHIATYDHEERRILVYGGLVDDDVADDLWELVLRE